MHQSSCSMPVDEFGRTSLKKETVQGGGECNSVVIQVRLVWDLVHLQYPANRACGDLMETSAKYGIF